MLCLYFVTHGTSFTSCVGRAYIGLHYCQGTLLSMHTANKSCVEGSILVLAVKIVIHNLCASIDFHVWYSTKTKRISTPSCNGLNSFANERTLRSKDFLRCFKGYIHFATDFRARKVLIVHACIQRFPISVNSVALRSVNVVHSLKQVLACFVWPFLTICGAICIRVFSRGGRSP